MVTTSAEMTSAGTGNQLTLDYCANVSWATPTVPAGEQIDDLVVQFGTDEIAAAKAGDPAAVGRYGSTATTYAVANGRGSFRIFNLADPSAPRRVG